MCPNPSVITTWPTSMQTSATRSTNLTYQLQLRILAHHPSTYSRNSTYNYIHVFIFLRNNHDICTIYNLNTCCHSLQKAAKIHVAAHSMNPNIVVPWLCCPIQIRKGRDMSIGGAVIGQKRTMLFSKNSNLYFTNNTSPRRNKLIILNLDFCSRNPSVLEN